MEIVEFSEQYRSQLIALWGLCGLIVPWNDPDKDINRKLKVDPDLLLLGLVKGDVVASVMGGYDGHRGWINYLAVAPKWQKQGFGRTLMQTIEAKLSMKGCPKINLQVRESNKTVIEFYQAIGYADNQVIGLGKRLEVDHE